MTTKAINFKIDTQLKSEFSQLAAELGLTTSAFLNVLIKRSVDEHGIPFEMKVPSKKPLPPAYQKLWVKEQAIELGLLPDDAAALSDKDFDEAMELYK